MSDPARPAPICPIHKEPMMPTATLPHLEKFHCRKCSCEIERPINPPTPAKP